METNYKHIEMLFAQVHEYYAEIERVQLLLKEYENIPEYQDVYDSLYTEEFALTVALSKLMSRLEQEINKLDNIFVRNRFSKDYAKLFKVAV